jgi:hypothetical protein
MKSISPVVLVFVLLVSAGCDSCTHLTVRGDGAVITREKTVDPFETIQISGNASVYFHTGGDYRVVLTVDSNVEKYVDIFTKNNTLNIGIRHRGVFFPTRYTVDVYAPAINGVSIAGAVHFEAADKIKAEAFSLKVSGAGSMKGPIECGNFSINISGSGEITSEILCSYLSVNISGSGKILLTGSGADAKINISGSGIYDGRDFETQRGVITVAGSAKVYIWASEYLNANVSGSGTIKYRGVPKIDYKGTGLGRIGSE